MRFLLCLLLACLMLMIPCVAFAGDPTPIQKEIQIQPYDGPIQKGISQNGMVQIEIPECYMQKLQATQGKPLARICVKKQIATFIAKHYGKAPYVPPTGVNVSVGVHRHGHRHGFLRCVGVHVRAICSGTPCPHGHNCR